MIHTKFAPQMRKTYMTLSQTRALAVDHPVGDPHGGPAYGKREAPAIAVVAAGASMYAGYAAIGATVGSMLVGGAMMAGGALSLVGTLSGNEKLSKIGGLLSLAGGVGGLASGAWEGAAKTVAERAGTEAAQGAATEALSQTPVAQAAAPAGSGLAEGATAATEAATSTAPVTSSPVAPTELGPLTQSTPAAAEAANGFTSATPTGLPTVPEDALSQGLVNSARAPVPPAASAPPAADPAFTARTSTGLPAVPGDTGVSAPGVVDSVKAGNYMDALKAAGSNVVDLAKSNPGAAMMLGNAVTGAADVLSGKAGAATRQANAAAAYYDAKTAEARREMEEKVKRRERLNQGYLNVNQAMPAGMSSNIIRPQDAVAAGLIAGARA